MSSIITLNPFLSATVESLQYEKVKHEARLVNQNYNMYKKWYKKLRLVITVQL